MSERAPGRLPKGARQEPAQQELNRLNEVERFIQYKANRFAEGDSMLAEDLAQEGREAVIRRLRADPDCPTSHLVLKAREAIYRYRRRGSSVDGKLNPKGRARQYQIVDLETPIGEDGWSLAEALAEPQAPARWTEQRASINILLDDLRDRLSATENQVLTLRLMAVPWPEVRQILGRSARETGQMREQIAKTVRELCDFSTTE